MILDRPTIFGQSGNTLLAGGEAGSEAVVGPDALMRMVQTAVESASKGRGDINVFVNSYGTDAASIAEDIGIALNRKLRMSGTW